MATFKVFHRKAQLFRTDARSEAHMVQVAEVNAHDLESVFSLTNHVDRAWWTNDGVTLVGPPNHRSTSVGDEVVNADTGERWVVEGMGFSLVDEG